MLKYLSQLFYPSVCLHCGKAIASDEQLFCGICVTEISFTDFMTITDNEMTERLIAMPQLQTAFAAFYYKKNAPISRVFYKMKYGNRTDYIKTLSDYAVGKWLSYTPDPLPDMITFVPIHASKQVHRGYNQSELIAASIHEATNIPVMPILKRTSAINTQTHFGRFDRLANQQNTITCIPFLKQYQHILLVDDILTTGATLETCSDAILSVRSDVLFSVFTLGLADNWR